MDSPKIYPAKSNKGTGGPGSENGPRPEKAIIKCLDGAKDELHCQFNPAQIKFSKTTQWNSKTDKAGGGGGRQGRGSEPKLNVPTSEFQGGNAQTLAMDLFFDTTETDDDVREYTDFLLSLTLINPKATPDGNDRGRAASTTDKNKFARPSLVKFVWGNFSGETSKSKVTTRSLMSFKAYVKDVSLNFTMFRADGTPVRAEAQVTFTAFEDDNAILPFQNPTSRSESRSMYLVRAGETLDYIAYLEYGDPNHWRHIADVNGLVNPLSLKPGQVLKITPLPL